MKFKKKTWAVLVLAAVLVWALVFLCNPLLRVRAFVWLHGDQLEEGLLNGCGVPVLWGVNTHNTWEGEHPMTEFILFTVGDTYYGCYYSYDGEPAPFQNADETLVHNGNGYWEWQGEGDNHGATQRIGGNWFYFRASF